MWFIGVQVGQETSAPPPKKNPGSAPVGVREIFCQGGGGGGAVNHLPKKISQVAQIFTKESERKEGRITTT